MDDLKILLIERITQSSMQSEPSMLHDSSKHSGVIAFFNQHYVKTGIFPKEASKIIKEASENRERADYLDFFIASKKDAEIQLAKAERFQALVTEYFKNKGIY